MSSSDVDQVKELWRDLTGAPSAFTSSVPLVVASDDHRASPPGWAGIIELCGCAVVACPTTAAERVAARLAGLTAQQLVQPTIVDTLLSPVDTLGPALLFYGRASISAAKSGSVIGPLEIDDPRVQWVIEAATDTERDEAGMEDTTSGVYLGLTPDGNPAAVCAWREWPRRVAHMSVLTATAHRSFGHGVATARVALDEAARAGLLPQWRSAHWNGASISVARRLGLELLGHQYSIQLS